MSKTTESPRWKDEFGFELQPGLTCHVEIDNKSGTTPEDIDKTTAWALRNLAAQIEAGKLEDGHHPIKAPNGEKIGEVYLDYYATDDLD